MLFKRIYFIFFILLFSFKAFPATFTVTSNADSGPGTLRDALTQAVANGTAATDYINFNLSQPSITILTDLPVVSSNLVIDASTQPGPVLGVNGAKIIIYAAVNSNNTITCCFNITGQHNIEIYGFVFDIPPDIVSAGHTGISGIYSGYNSKNISIGAPGKGNISKNIGTGISFAVSFDEPLTDSTISENIKISSNILGMDEMGQKWLPSALVSVNVNNVRNLTIGGNTVPEGNIFAGQVNINEYTVNLGEGNLFVYNNFFGTDYTGREAIANTISGTTLLINCTSLKQLNISKNLFVSRSDIGISEINCFFKITGNKFGTDVTGTKVLGTFQSPLVLGYCNGGGIVGGNNPGDGNIFSGAYTDPNVTGLINEGVVINVGSPGVELANNSFRCNNSVYPYQLEGADFSKYFVKISNRTANSVFGTATPNSRVDLYYSLSCDHCEPEQLFQSVQSDSAGNWIYTGAISNYNIIASSTFSGTTSEFTTLRFTNQPTNVVIKSACVGQSNGSITGITTNMNASYTWYDANGNIVARTRDLVNEPAGKYSLTISDGFCSNSSPLYEIKQVTNLIDTSRMKITEASCGAQNGSISGIIVDPSLLVQWIDQSGNILSTGTDLNNVQPGNYILIISTPDKNCVQTFGPYKVANTSGPNIDQSHASITSTNCGESTGSITNIQVTGSGTIKYSWLNDQQQQVATTKDLTGQPGGTYTLQVTDDSQCGTVFSAAILIPETNGINLDESKVQTTIAACGINNGTITGILATGATQYRWLDAKNKIVATTIDLTNVTSGDYTLTASNNFGCSKTSKVYHISLASPTVYPTLGYNITDACMGQANGGIALATDPSIKSYRWVNGQGTTVGNTASINNITPGTYQLYLTDQNGCESFYNKYTVNQIPALQITSAQVNDDQCSTGTGSITGIQVSGGTPPYNYSWTNNNGNIISTTTELRGLMPGSYILTVTDGSGCSSAIADYTIQDQQTDISAPSVSNLQICSPGNALLIINNPAPGYGYRLYDSEYNNEPISQSTNGKLTFVAKSNAILYVSQFKGNCESQRTKVQVTVGVSDLNIPNTITPNGDGINDQWSLPGIENYPNALVQIFTRYGQRVYESHGYAHAFDGSSNGAFLPAGVYYYVINLNSNCNLLSGSLTIIR